MRSEAYHTFKQFKFIIFLEDLDNEFHNETTIEVNFLSHAKVVSVWHQEFSKIVERRTFGLVNHASKYRKRHKMDKNTSLDNLGTPRTAQWPTNIKFLID